MNDCVERWPTKRLRYLTSGRPATDGRSLNLSDLSEVPFLPMEAIGEQGQLDLSTTRPLEEVKSGYSQFFEGDVVVANSRNSDLPLKLAHCPAPGPVQAPCGETMGVCSHREWYGPVVIWRDMG